MDAMRSLFFSSDGWTLGRLDMSTFSKIFLTFSSFDNKSRPALERVERLDISLAVSAVSGFPGSQFLHSFVDMFSPAKFCLVQFFLVFCSFDSFGFNFHRF